MATTAGLQFYVKGGVRRCVAAHRAGLMDIPAIIAVQGMPDVLTRILLNLLHSPKRQVARDYRYIRNTEYPTTVLKTEPPPIEVEPLGLPGQLPTVPISQVQLT